MIYNATSNTLSSVPEPKEKEYYINKENYFDASFNAALATYRSSLIQCADECREKWKDFDGKEVPEGMYIQQYERLNTSGGWMKTTKQIYNNTIGCYRRIIAYPVTQQPLIPNLDKSTANLSQIKDKDRRLDEVRGREPGKYAVYTTTGEAIELLRKISYLKQHKDDENQPKVWAEIFDYLSQHPQPAQQAGQEYKKIKRIAECAFNSVITIEGSAGFESWWKEELKINKWLQGLIGEPLPPYSETITTSEGQPAAGQETGVDEEEATFVQKHLVRFKEKFEENRAYLAAQSLEEAAKAFAMRKIGYRTLDNHDQWDDSKETFCVVAKSPEVAAYHYPLLVKEVEEKQRAIATNMNKLQEKNAEIVSLQSHLTALREREGKFLEWFSLTNYWYDDAVTEGDMIFRKGPDHETAYTTADLYAEFKKKGGDKTVTP